MGFISINEGFICEWCGTLNSPAPKTCRNHCVHCLCSKHVDETMPGDRESVCLGKMKVIDMELDKNQNFILVHQCKKCKKIIRNKQANDDEEKELFKYWETINQEKIKKTFFGI